MFIVCKNKLCICQLQLLVNRYESFIGGVRLIIRLFDIVIAVVGLLLAIPLMIFISLLCFFDTGSPLFRQVRVGKNLKPFVLLKFRTMRLETPSVQTDLVDPTLVTCCGAILRRTKLDELPQLWNVLLGEMSLVGPRPCLFNQNLLIHLRARQGVFKFPPGITGLSQIQGIDMSTPERLVKTDWEMLQNLSIRTYFLILAKTFYGKGRGDRIRKDII